MSFTSIRTWAVAVLLASSVLPVAIASKNDISDGSESGSKSHMIREKEEDVQFAAGWQQVLAFPMLAVTKVFPHLAPSKLGYIELTNLPGAADGSEKDAKGQTAAGAMINRRLQASSNYDKALGRPVTRAWTPHSGMLLLEVQSVHLAASAPQDLSGLSMARQQLGVRTITAADVEAKNIVLCAWARRQRFLMHSLLFGAAVSAIYAMFSSSWTSDPLQKKGSKSLPFHHASVVGRASGFQTNQQASCVARSLPKERGCKHWEI